MTIYPHCALYALITINKHSLRFGWSHYQPMIRLELNIFRALTCPQGIPPISCYQSIVVSKHSVSNSKFRPFLLLQRRKIPQLFPQRYSSSCFPPLDSKLPSFPPSLPVSRSAGGLDFLPRSSHLPKVPPDLVLSLVLPPAFFPPSLVEGPVASLDVLADSVLAMAPYCKGPFCPFVLLTNSPFSNF